MEKLEKERVLRISTSLIITEKVATNQSDSDISLIILVTVSFLPTEYQMILSQWRYENN